MSAKKFQRRKEDFVCTKCGTTVVGDGYTDHCPACLWSKHVDINPGDRASNCLGLMQPIATEGTGPVYTILYSCTLCSQKHRVKMHKSDSVDAIIALAQARAAKP
ncbi:RNHCP domain-containing protein [Candidatus Kaiserbacteria bacterium]|nr:RNHCP domain-containing protein [Candidatus Kaiserbacteria bacterium]